jgi:hypothetical protein
MNLADMLSYADIHQLGQIARNYDCECDGHSKNELIQTILSTIGRRTCLDAFVQDMSVEDIRFFNSLLYENIEGYSMEELTLRARQARFVAPGEGIELSRDMIVKYKHRGWLFNGHSQQTRYLFHTPKDLLIRVGDSLSQRFMSALELTDEPAAYRDEQNLLADDILCLLHIIAHQEVPLTADGTIYKRLLLSMLDSFSVKEQLIGKVSFRFGYRFSFIYDYCYYNDLICELDGYLWLTEKGRKRISVLFKEDLGQIFRLWIRLYKGPIPNVLSITNWILRLTTNWVTVESLIDCLCPLVQTYYYDTPQSILERRIIQMLMHLGMLRIGEQAEGRLVVKATPRSYMLAQGTIVSDEETIKLPEERS